MTKTNLIFNPFHILISGLLLTPLCSAIMVAMDYKRLKKRSWLVVALAPFLLVTLAVALDLVIFENVDPTHQLVFSFLITITYYLYQKRLESAAEVHSYRGFREVLGVGVVGFLITSVLLFVTLQ